MAALRDARGARAGGAGLAVGEVKGLRCLGHGRLQRSGAAGGTTTRRPTRRQRQAASLQLNAFDVGAAGEAASSHVAQALYSIADAAAAPEVTEAATKKAGFLDFSNILETFLKIIDGGLEALHVPYSYGFSIILLTLLVKAATFPLSKQQVESSMAMQALQPRIKEIQTKYANDQEQLQLETAKLYKQANVNPLAGCLPSLASLPIWIGLYKGLSNAASEGVLNEGFFWIPSLSGPTTIAARTAGTGLQWLFPFEDGAPPVGWHDAGAYLVLPVLLIVSQYISQKILSSQPGAPQQPEGGANAILKFLPLMIGWFSLNVPSGLTLYWFTNNILTVTQTAWLRQSFKAPEMAGAGSASPSAGGAPVVERVAAVKQDPIPAGRSGDKFWDLKRKESGAGGPSMAAAEVVDKTGGAPVRGAKFQALKQQEQGNVVKASFVDEEETSAGAGNGGGPETGDIRAVKKASFKKGTKKGKYQPARKKKKA